MNKRLDANGIKILLNKKHALDIGCDEVKTGPSVGGCVRLDYWAMKPSWATPAYTGYEIKVSRSDFLQDNKWVNYLPYCEYFYFVCPFGLIDPSEVPEKAGLMYASKTGSRIYTKKKAPYREVNVPAEILTYLLMWRMRENNVMTNAEYWKNWLEQKKENQEIGYRVKGRLRELHSEKVIEVQRNQKRLESKIKRYDTLKKFLDENNLSIRGWNIQEDVKSIIKTGLPNNIKHQLERARSQINEILKIGGKESE